VLEVVLPVAGGKKYFCNLSSLKRPKGSFKMVRLHVKKGDENLFLYDTTVVTKTDEVISDITKIYNGRLKVHRICCGKGLLNY